jgi:hypothetical protein
MKEVLLVWTVISFIAFCTVLIVLCLEAGKTVVRTIRYWNSGDYR